MSVGDYSKDITGSNDAVVSRRAKGSIAEKAEAYLQAVKKSQGPKG